MASKNVTKSIEIHASPAEVWKAITNLTSIKEWLSPEKTVEITTDWNVGSGIRYAGIIERKTLRDKGIVLEAMPEQLLKYSHWSSLSGLPDTAENYSRIAFTLEPQGDQTLITVTHSNFQREVQYLHTNFYWNGALTKIKHLVEEKNQK